MNFSLDYKSRGPYFEGLYFKLRSKDGFSLALIPALHIDKEGQRRGSLQLITDNRSFWLSCKNISFHVSKTAVRIYAGENLFTDKGIFLHADGKDFSLHGSLSFGPLSTLSSDIMGPFALFKGMECSHSIISMGHSLSGVLHFNGRMLDFSGGIGYIEGDSGRSFPQKYLWHSAYGRAEGLIPL